MSVQAIFKSMITISLLLLFSACATGSGFVHPKANFKKVGRLAVVVNSDKLNETEKKETADLFSMALLQKGFMVIDRANIDQILSEAEFQNTSELTSGEGAAKLRIHNVKSLVVVNVSSAGTEVSMTAKMTLLETGSLVWVGEGTGDSKSGLAALGGALFGGGAGAAAGSAVSGGSGTGTAIGAGAGAAAGAVAGKALEPSKKKLFREVIEKTTASLPSLVAAQS